VNSINETVRKYCASDSKPSPGRRTTAGITPSTSASITSVWNANVSSPTISRLHSGISVSSCSNAVLDHSFPPLNSVSKMSQMSNDIGEVSFTNLARQMLSPSPDHRPPAVSSKPASVDVGIQVNPLDFGCDVGESNSGRAEIGIQAGGEEPVVDVVGDGGSFSGRCCPYCHSQLPVGDAASRKDLSNAVVASSVSAEDSGARLSESVAASSATSVPSPAGVPPSPAGVPPSPVRVPSTLDRDPPTPARVPSFIQCSLSLGDSFHYSPVRNVSSVATAPITIYPSNDVTTSQHCQSVPVLTVSECGLPVNSLPADSVLGTAETNGSVMSSDMFVSHSQYCSESSLINTPVVTFSITPDAAHLPTLADSGGPLSNTSLSNITLSDLLPSMQGSIPLELLVNQTDGFTMYTEIVPVSEACHSDSLNLPVSVGGSASDGISDVAMSHEPWSPTRLVSQESPVNMMVCLPLSSVSSPSLSSFLSQHRSLSSFTGDAAPNPGTLAAGDTVETVAVAVVTSVEDCTPKPTENYSIHRIVETSALKRGAGVADCSWSSNNTDVLISRRDVAANAAALFDSSVDQGQLPDDNCQGNDDDGCHADNAYRTSFHGNVSCYGDDSCRGDDSDTHDDICVIDSDRDVIVIDGDDDVVRPNVGSDMVATAVPERTSRVGRHGRRRQRQVAKSSDADRLCGRGATVEVDGGDLSTSVNCLDNGFVEMSPSAADVKHNSPRPATCAQVIFSVPVEQVLFLVCHCLSVRKLNYC